VEDVDPPQNLRGEKVGQKWFGEKERRGGVPFATPSNKRRTWGEN